MALGHRWQDSMSSHDILEYSNAHFTKSSAPTCLTCSETLRHFITNPFYLISLRTTPSISVRLDRATILGFVAKQ